VARSGSAPTRARHVRAELRAELLVGRYQPGERLPVGAIAEHYTVSVTVAREALMMLASDGLVVSEPQTGFRVIELSTEHLADLTSVRVDIDCIALRRSITQAGLPWESAALAAHHTLACTPMYDENGTGVSRAWSTAHTEFHRALVAGCGSQILLELRDRLWDASTLYRSWSAEVHRASGRDVAREHRELLDAALVRDADRACALLAAHISRTTELVLEQREHAAKEDRNAG
jgi:DNA-binding GntR family transcriptional regulator